QRRLPMINMPNRPNIHMRLRTLKNTLRHDRHPFERVASCRTRVNYASFAVQPPTYGRCRRWAASAASTLELVDGIEPSTSPLPRECSTTELHEPARLLD